MTAWLRQPLSRVRYLVIGVLLAALKIALDAAIARAYGHPYSVLFYVSPIDAPLFHPGEDRSYWVSLAFMAAPFIAVGVALTVRRLHDAGMSPWFALLFFVPFANLLFFLSMVLVPTRPRAEPLELPAEAPYREPGAPLAVPPPRPGKRYPKLLSATFGAVVGLGAIGISVGLLRDYGVSLMLGAPTISGFVTGVTYARLAPNGRRRGVAAATALSQALVVGICIVFAIEGLGCLIMMLPLFFIPGFVGSLIGFEAARALPPRSDDVAVAASMMLFFVLLGVQRVSPLPQLAPPPLATSIEIDAPPARVWSLLPSMPDMPPPRDWAFVYAGITYPLRTRLEGAGVGAKRLCEFTTGPAVETVDEWVPERALGFTIDAQPDPMRELTLYQTVRQPHLDGYVRNVRGELSLEPLPGGRTRLTGKSWYVVRLAPERYWRLWGDLFIRKTHLRVLSVVKARAEGPPDPTLAAR